MYDLGGGTFDAAVLQRVGADFALVGEPGGDPLIGGEAFDDKIYRRLGETGLPSDVWGTLQSSDDPEWLRANWQFRDAVREAKEAVSQDSVCPVYIPPPVGRELQLTRDEVEQLVREDITTTIEILA